MSFMSASHHCFLLYKTAEDRPTIDRTGDTNYSIILWGVCRDSLLSEIYLTGILNQSEWLERTRKLLTERWWQDPETERFNVSRKMVFFWWVYMIQFPCAFPLSLIYQPGIWGHNASHHRAFARVFFYFISFSFSLTSSHSLFLRCWTTW